MEKIKGIIFDMDNTLLHSSINFAAMKQAVFSFLVAEGIFTEQFFAEHEQFSLEQHTTSTLIEEAVLTGRMTDSVLAELWGIVTHYEVRGMQGAQLEIGVIELLEQLTGAYRLVIVTNNSEKAAQAALEENGIIDYFDAVIGRESMSAMKPASAGFQAVVERYDNILPKEWIAVGDSWIDGKAATGAGIAFIAYQGELHKMHSRGVFPVAHIQDIRQLKAYISYRGRL